MTVRCKFKVDSIERTLTKQARRDASGGYIKDDKGNYVYEDREMWTVKMSPVYANNDPNHENSKFWEASPSGQFTLGTVNKAAVDQIELGKEVYIDLLPAS